MVPLNRNLTVTQVRGHGERRASAIMTNNAANRGQTEKEKWSDWRLACQRRGKRSRIGGLTPLPLPCAAGKPPPPAGQNYFCLGQPLSNPPCENTAKTERLNRSYMQLELSFSGTTLNVKLSRRERRISRAGWWFAQMRQLVDRAMVWDTAAEPRPEQIWLPGDRHHVHT